MSDTTRFPMPSVYVYSNKGSKGTCLEWGDVRVWMSYQTVVAFHFPGHERVVIQNYWGNTTACHLAAIDGGVKGGEAHKRVDRETFRRLWDEQAPAAVAGILPDAEPALTGLERDYHGDRF